MEPKIRTTYNVLNKKTAHDVSLENVTYLSGPEWLQIMHYKTKKETIHHTLHTGWKESQF